MGLTISPPTYCICFDFLSSLFIFPPSLCEILANVNQSQEMGRHLPLRGARSREERTPISQGASPLGAAEKWPWHHPTPRPCISLRVSHRPYARCPRQETAAFASRTGVLPTTRAGAALLVGAFNAPGPIYQITFE